MRPGGTTYYFVNEDIEHVLNLARAAAGDRDIRIAGGADVIQQYLKAVLVDELQIALAPGLFGSDRRLFENIGDNLPAFKSDKRRGIRRWRHICAMFVDSMAVGC